MVRTVLVNENDLVKKGDVLAELDTTRIVAQVEGARASARTPEPRWRTRTRTAEGERAGTRPGAETLDARRGCRPEALDTAVATRSRASAAVKMAKASLLECSQKPN